MPHSLLKYILDIETVISEIEEVKRRVGNSFLVFNADFVIQRAVERDLEIIGEAVKKMKEIDPLVQISSASKIIGLRNILFHAYDSVDPELIWGIIQRDIPILK